MKTLGLIGGMSWESTIEYYRLINEMVKERLGGWNSAKLLLYSVNFQEILPLQNEGKWNEITQIMIDIAKALETAGSSSLIICSNTIHKISDELEKQLKIPLIHIVDETGKVIKSKKMRKIGLLGTIFTMEGGFYEKRLISKFGLHVIIPNKVDRDYINNAIYNELAQGILKPSTKAKFINIIGDLEKKGAEGIILACTEIPLLISQKDVDIQLFNTLTIHLDAAVKFILN